MGSRDVTARQLSAWIETHYSSDWQTAVGKNPLMKTALKKN